MGNLYKYFGMGRVPKIPLIKIGVGNHWEGPRPGGRAVMLNTDREGVCIDDALFLASKS